MGLLKGAGRRLRGLFAEGGLFDSLEAAQAWLDGDYERGMALTRRNRRRKPRPGESGVDKAGDPDRAYPSYYELHESRHLPIPFEEY